MAQLLLVRFVRLQEKFLTVYFWDIQTSLIMVFLSFNCWEWCNIGAGTSNLISK